MLFSSFILSSLFFAKGSKISALSLATFTIQDSKKISKLPTVLSPYSFFYIF
jgi:hypothetical protein